MALNPISLLFFSVHMSQHPGLSSTEKKIAPWNSWRRTVLFWAYARSGASQRTRSFLEENISIDWDVASKMTRLTSSSSTQDFLIIQWVWSCRLNYHKSLSFIYFPHYMVSSRVGLFLLLIIAFWGSGYWTIWDDIFFTLITEEKLCLWSKSSTYKFFYHPIPRLQLNPAASIWGMDI